MKTWLLTLACLFAVSCGYSSGLRVPEGHESVGLEVFANPSALRNLEGDVYRALSASMTQLVSTPLVAPDDADLRVRGRIIEFRRRGGVRDENNRLQETGNRVTVEAWLETPSGTRVGELAETTMETGYIVGEGSLDTSTLDKTVRNPIQERANELSARERTLRLAAEELVFELFARLD